jgi:hypothetical protein
MSTSCKQYLDSTIGNQIASFVECYDKKQKDVLKEARKRDMPQKSYVFGKKSPFCIICVSAALWKSDQGRGVKNSDMLCFFQHEEGTP